MYTENNPQKRSHVGEGMGSTSRDFCQLVEWWHSLQFVCVRLGRLSLSIPCLNLFLCPGNPALEDTAECDNWARREGRKSIQFSQQISVEYRLAHLQWGDSRKKN